MNNSKADSRLGEAFVNLFKVVFHSQIVDLTKQIFRDYLEHRDDEEYLNQLVLTDETNDKRLAKLLMYIDLIDSDVFAEDQILHGILHISVHPLAIKKLVSRGANPNALNKDGYSPLHMFRCEPHSIRALVECGAEVNVAENKCGQTPLHALCIRGSLSAMKALLEHGAAPFVRDNYGNTPVDYCNSERYFDAKRGRVIDHHIANSEAERLEKSTPQPDLIEAVRRL